MNRLGLSCTASPFSRALSFGNSEFLLCWIMAIQTTLASRHFSRGDEARPCGRPGPQKVWRRTLLIFFYCKPLKSLKTAKGIFGKAWRETAQIWKGLAKSLEPSRSEEHTSELQSRSDLVC